MAKQPTKIDLQEELEKTKVKLKEKTEESEKEINQIRKDASGIGITTVLYVLGLILVSTGFLHFLAFSQTATLIPIACFIIIGVFLGSILIVSVVNKCSSKKASCLCLVPLLILLLGIVPLSKYHNLNQIEHDKKIVEMLQITSDPNDPNGVKILLPAKYVSENKYIRQVLCFKWPNQPKEK